MSPGGWGARETGGFFHTLEVCEGVWSLGAVCVLVLQAVGCLCSDTGRFPSTRLCSSAASGGPSLAARLVPQACSPCPLWQGAGTHTAGASGVGGSSQGRSAVGWAGCGLQSPGLREAARGPCWERECELCSTGPNHVLLALPALTAQWVVIAGSLAICR